MIRGDFLRGGVLAFVALLTVQAGAQAPAGGATLLLENDRVRIERLERQPAGDAARIERPAVSLPEDSVIIALGAGRVAVSTNGERGTPRGVEAGETWWWPKAPAAHAIVNVGQEPIGFVRIRLKEDADSRPEGADVPRPAVVPGIVTLLDNDRVLVEKLTFAAGQRTDPPGGSHPEYIQRDVIIMALTAGEYEVSSTGETAESGLFQPGKVWWWPMPPATHSIANLGAAPYDFVKISLK